MVVRARKTTTSKKKPPTSKPGGAGEKYSEPPLKVHYQICVVNVVLLLVGYLLFRSIHANPNTLSRNFAVQPADYNAGERSSDQMFTVKELQDFGASSTQLYLSILGSVFDVSKGKKHYGPGGSYSFFTGVDASRAFITGDFTPDGLTDDLAGLSDKDILALEEWKAFYHKGYKYLGKLIGRFYAPDGKAKQALKDAFLAIQRARTTAEVSSILIDLLQLCQIEELEKQRNPNCNSRWAQGVGGSVWCDGGRLPRMLFARGQKRCACVTQAEAHAAADAAPVVGSLDEAARGGQGMELFPNCAADAVVCKTSDS